MPEVKFPSIPQESPSDYLSCSGNYRNAKLEISDWTTGGTYDGEESDEGEESEEESEDT